MIFNMLIKDQNSFKINNAFTTNRIIIDSIIGFTFL